MSANTITAPAVEHGWTRQEFSGSARTHWERCGMGRWSLEVRAFAAGASSLEVNASEHGEKSSKQTMVTLDKEQAIALRDFLIAHYPPA